jgi:hypothetical protein
MVRFVMVARDPRIIRAVRAACAATPREANASRCEEAGSIDDAALMAARDLRVVLLFEFHDFNDSLARELRAFRKKAPVAPIGAVLPDRKFDSEEIMLLRRLDVREFIDRDALKVSTRLTRLLHDAVNAMLPAGLLARAAQKLTEPEERKALRFCMRAVLARASGASDAHSHAEILRDLRPLVKATRCTSAETWYTISKLLVLLGAALLRDRKATSLFAFADFGKREDARKALTGCIGMGAKEIDTVAGIELAVNRLLEVLSGDRIRVRREKRRRGARKRTSGQAGRTVTDHWVYARECRPAWNRAAA